MKNKAFKCIYSQDECRHINTSGMSKSVECDNCNEYQLRQRASSIKTSKLFLATLALLAALTLLAVAVS